MSENDTETDQRGEHGVEEACYTNGPDGYQPVFRCLCGFGTGYWCGSWQAAGEEFDEHLEATRSDE